MPNARIGEASANDRTDRWSLRESSFDPGDDAAGVPRLPMVSAPHGRSRRERARDPVRTYCCTRPISSTLARPCQARSGTLNGRASGEGCRWPRCRGPYPGRLDRADPLADLTREGGGVSCGNDDCFATSVGWECIIWGASLLEGPDGDWDCTYSGTGDPMGGNDGLVLDTCTGTGGNSGLTFMAQQAISFSSPADFGDGTSIQGVLYEGPPPPPSGPLPSPASEWSFASPARRPVLRVAGLFSGGPTRGTLPFFV